MQLFERCLLYTTAILFAISLLWEGIPGQSRSMWNDQARSTPLVNPQSRTTEPAVESAPSGVEPNAGAVSPWTHRGSLLVTDKTGRPRIELLVDAQGDARILMRNEAGDATVSLIAGSGDRAEVVLQHGARSAGVKVESGGGMEIHMSPRGESGVFASVTPAGDVEFALQGRQQNRVRLAVAQGGEAEVSVGGRHSGIEAWLRAEAEGGADIAVHNADTGGGASQGDCTVTYLPNRTFSR